MVLLGTSQSDHCVTFFVSLSYCSIKHCSEKYAENVVVERKDKGLVDYAHKISIMSFSIPTGNPQNT